MNRHILFVGQFMNAAAENIVLGDDLLNVETIAKALAAMCGRAAGEKLFINRLVHAGTQRISKLFDKIRNAIVERRSNEILRRWEFQHLLNPACTPRVALLVDQLS